MKNTSGLKVDRCIWLRSGSTDRQYIFRSLRDTLTERGVTFYTLNGPKDAEGLETIRKAVWNSDAHVIIDGMTPVELRTLRPVFEQRKNFSMALVDWWTSSYWFTRNATYLIFRNYNGIAARRGLGRFMEGRRPPLVALPDKMVKYCVICSALRLPALAAAPVLQAMKHFQRQSEHFPADRLLYFPFTIAEKHVPLQKEAARYDFSNVSSTGGYWTMRDPHASAWMNYGNLYYDRWRVTDLISQNGNYRVFDLRKSHYLNWDEYCNVIRSSRFVVATGGMHQNSVAKYSEFVCLGVPMIGEEIPYEFPWLRDCLYPVDTLNVKPQELAGQLREALTQESKLRENCLNLRDTLLKLYHPHRILDLLQEQADGKPIPPGYLKPEAVAQK